MIKVDGQTAASRRARGVCVGCGLRPPKPDAKAGFPALFCASCEAESDKVNAKARKTRRG